jgi:ribosomal protein S12 methylthiotransferase accessory factor
MSAWTPADPFAAGPAPKGFRAGTHRVIAPAATMERAQRLMPVLGITRIANVTGLDSVGIPVVMVTRPNARSLAVAQGKGLTLEAARVSGLMESIESYHAEHILLPLRLAAYEEVRYTHAVADVALLPPVAAHRFHPQRPLLWIEGWDLLSRAPAWLPFESVHTDYTTLPRELSGAFVASSNGLASGNHVLEAFCHALYEVVERDATTLFYLADPAAQAQRRVDLASIDDPDSCAVIERFHAAGLLVGVWEITSDIALPAFVCRVADAQPNPLRPLYAAEGAGCHSSAGIALVRALLEAAQARLTMIAGSRDDWLRHEYARALDPATVERRRAEIAVGRPQRTFTQAAHPPGDSFAADLSDGLERLRAVGITQAIMVDLSRREFGIPVVKLVVPGLERLAGGLGYTPGQRGRMQNAECRMQNAG